MIEILPTVLVIIVLLCIWILFLVNGPTNTQNDEKDLLKMEEQQFLSLYENSVILILDLRNVASLPPPEPDGNNEIVFGPYRLWIYVEILTEEITTADWEQIGPHATYSYGYLKIYLQSSSFVLSQDNLTVMNRVIQLNAFSHTLLFVPIEETSTEITLPESSNTSVYFAKVSTQNWPSFNIIYNGIMSFVASNDEYKIVRLENANHFIMYDQ